MSQSESDDLIRRIQERRRDPEFMGRLRQLIDENQDVLDRLADDPERLSLSRETRSDERDGWWQCSDGDVFRTREQAVDHLRLVEVDGAPDRLRQLPDGEWEAPPRMVGDD